MVGEGKRARMTRPRRRRKREAREEDIARDTVWEKVREVAGEWMEC